jgi:hypothetical protein
VNGDDEFLAGGSCIAVTMACRTYTNFPTSSETVLRRKDTPSWSRFPGALDLPAIRAVSVAEDALLRTL